MSHPIVYVDASKIRNGQLENLEAANMLLYSWSLAGLGFGRHRSMSFKICKFEEGKCSHVEKQ
ncbi:MAG: hypothetical protein ACK2T4_11780 [Candidatus Promineifilaceae bacterium]|jgi:hypothetical protein